MLRAVAGTESNFNPKAVSKAGAQGLMGIMPDTQKYLGITDPTDPIQSIFGGAKYMSEGLDAEKTPEGALLYYHGGPGWRAAYGPESAAYVPAVTKRYQAFTTQAAPAAPAAPASDPFSTTLKASAALADPSTQTPVPPDWGAGHIGDTGHAAYPAAMMATPQGRAAAAAAAASDRAGAATAAAEYGWDPTGKIQPNLGGSNFPVPPIPPGAPNDPFSAALKAASQPAPAASTSDPFSSALSAAQKEIDAAKPADTPNPDAGLNEYGITGDPQQFNNLKGPEIIPQPVANVISAAAKGAVEGFGNPIGQTILSPQAQASLDARQRAGGVGGALAGLGSTVAQDISTAGGIAAGVGGAALRGVQGAVAQTGAELGAPRLGRDLAAIPEAFAGSPEALHTGEPTALPAADGRLIPRTAAQGNLLADFPRPTDLPSPTPEPAVANPLSGAPTPNALTGAATPAPQSVGAAASSFQDSQLTPKQVQAYRSTAEGQKLLEPQSQGTPDNNVYVPGVTPNEAELEHTVNSARELKAINMSAPEVSQEAKEVAAQNNDARSRYFSNVAGSDVDVANAVAERSAQAEKDLAATWQNKTDADPQPVLDAAQQIKESPDGRRPLVRNAVDSVTKELYDPSGNLITDPELLYGVRKHVDDLLSKEAASDDPKSIRAASNLQALKSTLDGVIEKAAPGFGDYLQNFSEASKPIDTMQALQGFENKLYDSQNRMGYNKVQTMMRQIVDSRQAPGINAFKSIPDDTMQKLWALRDDLRRSASAQELARAPGSDTAQNLMDMIKGVGKTGANAAIHTAVGAYLGPGGNFVLRGAQNLLNARAEKRAAAKQTARGMQMLHPDPSRLRNPLQGE